MERDYKKDMLARNLKRSNAQGRTVMKWTILEQMDDDDIFHESFLIPGFDNFSS